MDFFTNAIDVLQTLVIALGGGLCVWGGINLLEGYGQDNPASKSPGYQAVYGELDVIKTRKEKHNPDGTGGVSRNIAETQGPCYNRGRTFDDGEGGGRLCTSAISRYGTP